MIIVSVGRGPLQMCDEKKIKAFRLSVGRGPLKMCDEKKNKFSVVCPTLSAGGPLKCVTKKNMKAFHLSVGIGPNRKAFVFIFFTQTIGGPPRE